VCVGGGVVGGGVGVGGGGGVGVLIAMWKGVVHFMLHVLY
jgi:hypothetical protein